MNALAVFEAAYRRAEAGDPASFVLSGPSGHLALDPHLWCRDELPGDRHLLARCTGPTLDVGCGPGRLAAALARAGRPALGIDVSAAAVRMALRRGATALRRDVFGALPGSGRWAHLLLADGNIGIGGDPQRLLRRCRHLLAPGGRAHVELAVPGTPTWSGIAVADNLAEATVLAWATVAADGIGAVATQAGMRVLDVRSEAGRWFATLTPR